MIAYNHYIQYIPPLLNEAIIKETTQDKIIIKESSSIEIVEKLIYQQVYSNTQGRNVIFSTTKNFFRTEKGQLWGYEVIGVVHFFWYSGTSTLYYIPQKNFTSLLLKYWSLHLVLPTFFTLEERYNVLHAGAVDIEGKSVLFVAKSFGGKSTMTDFFIQKGHKMISDDKVACLEDKGNFFALPSYPYHRPYRTLEDLGYAVKNMATLVKPIHGIYELKKSEPDSMIEIIELKGIQKFKTLRSSNEFNLSFLKTIQFAFFFRFSKKIAIYQVSVPWDLERLSEVYETICKHSESVKKML